MRRVTSPRWDWAQHESASRQRVPTKGQARRQRYAEIMKPPFPPRSAVYVGMPRNLLVQIEVFAYKPTGK